MKSRGGIEMSTLSGAGSGEEQMTQFAGDPNPSSQAAEDVPVVAYMTMEGLVFTRSGNYLTRHISSPTALVLSDIVAHYGPLVELVARPDWRPAAAVLAGYLDVFGAFWRVGTEDATILYRLGPAGSFTPDPTQMYTRSEVERSHGPLTALMRYVDDQEPARFEPAPEPASGPDPLGMFGFEGKWMECVRRTPAGPWCEWRTNTSRLSLGVLVIVARDHAVEAHDG